MYYMYKISLKLPSRKRKQWTQHSREDEKTYKNTYLKKNDNLNVYNRNGSPNAEIFNST